MKFRIALALGVACAPLCAYGQNVNLGYGAYNSSPLTLSSGQEAPLQVDQNGNLKVNVAVGGSSGGSGGTVTQGTAGTAAQAWYVQPGTNATFPISGSIGNSAFGANQGTPASAANAWPIVIEQGGAALSTANPIFVQLGQGGSALSTANPLFDQITNFPSAFGANQGTAAGLSGAWPVLNAYTGIGGANTAVSPTTPLPVGAPDVRASGSLSLTSTSNAYTISLANGQAVVGWTIVGDQAGGATLAFQVSNDNGTTWTAANAVASNGTTSSTITTDGNYSVRAGGHTMMRLLVTTAGTGSATITYSASVAASVVVLGAPITVSSGNITTSSNTITVAPTAPTVTAAAYSAGYEFGGLITVGALERASATTTSLQKVVLGLADTQTPALDLIIFNAAPTATTFKDDAALSIAAADVPKIAGVVHLTDCTSDGTPTTCQAQGLQFPISVATAGASEYAVLVTRAAITPGSTSDITNLQLIGYSD